MKRLGPWCRETFRYGFLIVFFPRSITLEFLERPDTELRRWLRLLPCFGYFILIDMLHWILNEQGSVGPYQEQLADLWPFIPNALLSSLCAYAFTTLLFWIPHRIWGGDWRKVRTVGSLSLYALGVSIAVIALVGGAITLAVLAGIGEGTVATVVAVLFLGCMFVTFALASSNIYTMQSAVIDASPSALFWLLNGGIIVGYFVLVVVMASIRGPVL